MAIINWRRRKLPLMGRKKSTKEESSLKVRNPYRPVSITLPFKSGLILNTPFENAKRWLGKIHSIFKLAVHYPATQWTSGATKNRDCPRVSVI